MKIPLVMACNDGYAPALGVAILSLQAQQRDEDQSIIHILYSDLSHPQIARLEGLSRSGCTVRCIRIDPPELPETSNWVSRETYYRLLAADLLPEYDKLLYLDCDVIVLSDLSELYRQELGDHLLAGVCDFRFDGGYASRVIGVPSSAYINASVLLIQADLWRRERIAPQCLSFLRTHQNLEAYDQDALNSVCRDRILLLDKKWNFQQVWPEIFNWHPRHEEFRRIAQVSPEEPFQFSETGILHYVCAEKPWRNPQRELSEYFWRCARGSVFYEMLLCPPAKGENRLGPIRRGWSCLREHGPAYTLKRILHKATNGRVH